MTPPTKNAAAPSPFTPIASYGFLSNCHTAGLVARDGTVDWLCVPRFDPPSVFGALLDHEPGANTLVTSWKTPTGWVVVVEAAARLVVAEGLAEVAR